jgi:phospholipase C
LRRNATADPGQPLEKEFDMNVTRFLESLAQEVGEERLEGAIVLLALKRPIDDLIRLALAAGPYHPGHRSPWSHTILVAGKFSGASTPILDCTIRADDGSILWDEPLLDFIKRDPTEQGGIYDGKLGNYDHARVTNAGVKLLDDLTPAEQTAILGKGLELQAAGYHYDIPGLVRELVRLLTGITIPAGEKLLFCSAFCQAAYAALGQKGDFAPQIATVDTTPDDIWYSARGRSIPSRKKAKAAKGAGLAAKEVQSAAAVRGLDHVNHIVVLMLENRSFDHLLGYLKAENPEIEGLVGTEVNPEDPGATPPIPTAVNDNAEYKGDLEVDPGHDQSDVGIELYGTPAYNFTLDPVNNGFVFDYIRRNQGDRVKGRKIMKCFAPSKLDALATLARQFAVCDHWFSSVPGPTWPNRFFAHAATSAGHVDNAFRFYAMDTIYHQLQTVGVSWGVYFHDIPQVLAISSLWGDMFKQRFHRFERFFEAARRGTLPAYSFLEPRYFEFFFTKRANDEHPPHDVLEGEQLISDVYNALRESPAWERTLLVVLYDEHGGTYDHIPPPPTVNPDGKVSVKPRFDFTRLGVRVPAVLVSPFIPAGTVDHNAYDHTSILATVRRRFDLPVPLTARDGAANTFGANLSLPAARTDAPEKIAPTGRTARSAAERARAYAPLPPSRARQAVQAGEASDAPLTELQESLVALARQLNSDRPAALRALRAARPVETEHQAAIHVREEVLDFLNR